MARVLVWILGDQLLEDHPALHKTKYGYGKDDVRVVLVESAARIRQLPYQRKKLVLLLSAMRHYAEKLRDDGWDVVYVQAENTVAGLRQAAEAYQPETCVTMAASEWRGRQFQQERLGEVVGCEAEVLPNTQFLVGQYDPYPEAAKDPDENVVMEYFYRKMRVHFDLLMDDPDTPAGGAWNYDKDNRKKLPKNANPPRREGFTPDAVTQDVMEQVAAYDHAVGSVDGFNLAVTHAEAQEALARFIAERLEKFGPYEDSMSHEHGELWHSVLSPYLNIGLLTPLEAAQAVADAYRRGDAPINSVEGFVRQVIGWREFMYWQYWRLMPALTEMNAWEAHRPMPDFFWDPDKTDMNCLKQAVTRARDTGYNHHIERLMVITNFCTLAGIEPQAVVEWMRAYYIDAYDWVMQTNVVGMGLNADGGIIATKPYVSSANYINKMGDFCQNCALARTKRHGEGACPFNFLYWNFMLEHEDRLRANPRTGRAVLGLRHLDEDERQAVQAAAADFLDGLSE
jgi:deoxyribodipyrimidine photolyase-related protein